MKQLLSTLLLIALAFQLNAQTPTVHGEFQLVSRDLVTGIMTVKLVVAMDETWRTDSLGTSTILFTLSDNLTLSAAPVANTHFVFHNFSSGNYALATITKPFANQNQYSINIELLGQASSATPVVKRPNWTDVVTLRCTTSVPIGPPLLAEVKFLATNPDFALYDNDNLTPWNKGSFINLEFYIPVELTSFTLSSGDNEAILNWETATEKNNSGFEIERKIEDGEWQKIGFVTGKGTTTVPQSYTYRDGKLTESGNYAYRLKQIDYNGVYEYSKEMTIYIDAKPKEFSLSANYPNPFNPTTTINFAIPENVHVTLQVYDAIGNLVLTLVNESKSAGNYDITFDAAKLSSGVYYYRLQAGQFLQTKKLILMK